MLSEYDNIIREQLNHGIVEYVDESQKPKSFKAEYHYLPHHGFVRQDSETTKLRIVYDGSAKAMGNKFSLNDCLLNCPNSITKLFNILIQFRWNPVRITADIEKTFLMISNKPSERNFLRFLWIKDPYQGQSSELVEKLQASLYVDDFVTSTPNAHSAYEFYLECRKLMAAGGMNLRKWHSNSSELLERIKSLPVGTSLNPNHIATNEIEEA